MIEPLPDPFVPPGTDVRDLDGFMFNVERLLASELVAIGTPEECWAALMLWCRAWKQIPGGSLPNDDRILASFSGAGKRWAKVKAVALRGFVLCSDDRLYHRFLCAEVMRASQRQMAFRARRDADRKRLAEWRARRDETVDETQFERCFVAEGTGTGTGTGTVNKKDSPPTPRKRGASALEGFEDWWKGYPSKIGKGAAERAWPKALALASLDELKQGVQRYILAKPPDREWCHPATWLNQKRWLDQPAGTGPDPPSNTGPTGPPPRPEELWPDLQRELSH